MLRQRQRGYSFHLAAVFETLPLVISQLRLTKIFHLRFLRRGYLTLPRGKHAGLVTARTPQSNRGVTGASDPEHLQNKTQTHAVSLTQPWLSAESM